MMASAASDLPGRPPGTPAPQPGVEAAFRAAVLDSLAGLALGDHNLLRFHYGHQLGPDQLAAMFASSPAAVTRQLARIRERLLRDTRRRLADRLVLDRRELDHLIEPPRHRFELALTRILGA